MKKLLLASAALLAMTMASHAVVIDLGVNPVSSTGDFSTAAGGDGAGPFEDQVQFQLVGGPQFITIANATNVYPQPSDFITNWEASIWLQVGTIGGADDVLLFGPQDATACPITPSCQVVGGSGILAPGNYYAEFTGIGGGTSGYGGNISALAVPGPAIGAGFPALVAALGGFFGWRRLRRT